jgi:hypothetical protein
MEAIVNLKASPVELNLLRLALQRMATESRELAKTSQGEARKKLREQEAQCSLLLQKLGG